MALLGDPRLTVDKAAAACHCGISMKRLQLQLRDRSYCHSHEFQDRKLQVSIRVPCRCSTWRTCQIIYVNDRGTKIDAVCCCCGSVEAEVLHAAVPGRRGSHTRTQGTQRPSHQSPDKQMMRSAGSDQMPASPMQMCCAAGQALQLFWSVNADARSLARSAVREKKNALQRLVQQTQEMVNSS